MDKVKWADVTDDDPWDDLDIVVSKHGIKVKKPIVVDDTKDPDDS